MSLWLLQNIYKAAASDIAVAESGHTSLAVFRQAGRVSQPEMRWR
jgi:hypothetical protein